MKSTANNMDSKNNDHEKFTEEVGKSEQRKINARKRRSEDVWFGLGMFGLVGWAVSVPTLIGLAIGIWIDSKWKSPISWTLIFLFIGVVLGCLNAWYWVSRERQSIEKERNNE